MSEIVGQPTEMYSFLRVAVVKVSLHSNRTLTKLLSLARVQFSAPAPGSCSRGLRLVLSICTRQLSQRTALGSQHPHQATYYEQPITHAPEKDKKNRRGTEWWVLEGEESGMVVQACGPSI